MGTRYRSIIESVISVVSGFAYGGVWVVRGVTMWDDERQDGERVTRFR